MRVLRIYVLVCLRAATLALFMPHLHSPAARLVRRERAIARGFLVFRDSHAFIRTLKPVAGRVAVAARSVELRYQHLAIAGSRHAFPLRAADAARPWIGEEAYAAAARAHRARNRAVHHWPRPPGICRRWAGTAVPAVSVPLGVGPAAACSSPSGAKRLRWADLADEEDLEAAEKNHQEDVRKPSLDGRAQPGPSPSSATDTEFDRNFPPLDLPAPKRVRWANSVDVVEPPALPPHGQVPAAVLTEPAAEVLYATRRDMADMFKSVANSIGGLATSLQQAVSPERFQAEVDCQIEQPLAAILERFRVLDDSAAEISLRLGSVERRLAVLAEELATRPGAESSLVGPDPLRPEPLDFDGAPHDGEEVFARRLGLANERSYNLRPVRLWSAPGRRDRVPVQLADSGEFIKVKPANLGVYHPAEQDICCRCGGLLNLFALPPCERNPTLTSTATASSSSVSSASPA